MYKLALYFTPLTLIFLLFSSEGKGMDYPKDYPFQKKQILLSMVSVDNYEIFFHEDSVHRLDFRYPHKRKGIKPWIVPAALTAAGTSLHYMTGIREDVRDFARKNLSYSGRMDDFIQYTPFAAVYALNAAGVQGKNNFGNRTAIAVKTILLWNTVVSSLKTWTKVQRPNGDFRSFPSGHTSFSFTMAHFMHHEFGERSPWYSIGAYSVAITVGMMRIARNAHWVSDVVAGAGIGIITTEMIYLTHQYKWDQEHLKNWDIFPFRMNRQNGVTLVYTF